MAPSVNPATQHLDPDTLAAYVDGRLAIDELDVADRHIDACGSCRTELSALAAVQSVPRNAATAAGDPVPYEEVANLGRYHVLRELGRGSMGIVLRAYDPELARPVAIKLLRDVAGFEQLREEARTLARLRHPNVVTVYDVFADEHGMYLAMELVDGGTLRTFCKGRSPREIMAACVKAGRGLAAAHDAGVIHRDFKPENVLCTDDGEVRVSDFGLARAVDAAADGAIAGTPAYMAPEVLKREPATSRSDQYSYCVTVYEMLTGARPASDDARASTVPPWIWRVLRRGLAREPSARYPTMHELADALADDPAVVRRKRVLVGGVAIAALVTGAGAMQLAGSAGSSCDIDGAALGDAWNGQRKAEVSRAIAATSDAEAGARVASALDDYANTWVGMRRVACEARGQQSQLMLDRRVACLDRGRRELGELVHVLASADARLAGTAQEAISKLRDPRTCTGLDEGDTLPVDAVGRVVTEQARTVVDRATALQTAGKHDEADALASQVLAQLEHAAMPRLRGEALLVRGRVAIDRGHHDRAEQLLFDALRAASEARDDRLAAMIWVEIVMTTGAQKHRFDLAMSNARAAEAALARIEAGGLQVRYEYTLGTMLLAQGKLDDARTHLERGLDQAGTGTAKARGQRGLIHAALCDVDRQRNQLRAASEQCTKSLELLEAAFGPEHLKVANTLNVVGGIAFGQHDWATAERTYKRVVSIHERRKATDHLTYALALSNLGAVYSSRDEIEAARSHFERALAVFDAHHKAHPQRVLPLQGLASLALRLRDAELAIRYYHQVRDTMSATYAPEHPSLLIAHYNLALAYRDHREPAKAQGVLDTLAARATTPGKEQWALASRALDLQATLADDRKDYRAALPLLERALAALEHLEAAPDRGILLRHLGETHRLLNQPAKAIEPFERALRELEPLGDPYDLGTTRYKLALSLWQTNRDKRRALELTKQARDDLAKAKTGERLDAHRKNVDKMLDAFTKELP